jgi:uncharacterized protein YqhQ
MADMRRVFEYHGAEHKVVNAYEAGAPLEVESIQQYSTAHARCGTNFLLVVLILSIFVFAIFGRPDIWMSILSRIVLIPVIASIGYEFIRFGGAHMHNPVIHIFSARFTPSVNDHPGIRITVRLKWRLRPIRCDRS